MTSFFPSWPFVRNADVPQSRLGRVSAALPQEYTLVEFLKNIRSEPVANFNTLRTPACQWYEVECDEHGVVVGVFWSCFGHKASTQALTLRGIPRWEHLPGTLTSLFLYNNALEGTVPFQSLPAGLLQLELSTNWFFRHTRFLHLTAGPQGGGGSHITSLTKRFGLSRCRQG